MQEIYLKESKEHGDISFPFAFYHVTEKHPRYIMETHWHEECEICRVLAGELRITIDGKTYIGRGRDGVGDIFFINSGSLHSAEPINCVYECVVFDMHFLLRERSMSNSFLYSLLYNQRKFIPHIPIPLNSDQLLRDNAGLVYQGPHGTLTAAGKSRGNNLASTPEVMSSVMASSIESTHLSESDRGSANSLSAVWADHDSNPQIATAGYGAAFEEEAYGAAAAVAAVSSSAQVQVHVNVSNVIYNLFRVLREKHTGYELKTFGLMYYLLGFFEDNDLFVKPESAGEAVSRIMKMRLALSFIHRNYKQEISLTDLSDLLDLKPPSVVKLFKDIINRRPMEYINSYRIHCAMELLKDNKSNVTTVAYDCGFSDVSYFSKVFKKYAGRTPREYLKKLSHDSVI